MASDLEILPTGNILINSVVSHEIFGLALFDGNG